MPSLADRVRSRWRIDGRPPVVISDAQIEDKFRDFAAPHFPQRRVREIIDLIWTFDEQSDVVRLFDQLAL